jgi:hypothetical protein
MQCAMVRVPCQIRDEPLVSPRLTTAFTRARQLRQPKGPNITVNSTFLLPPPWPAVDARLLLAAAMAGARRSLRGQPREAVEDAAAEALVAVFATLQRSDVVVRVPEAFAATAGRNSGTDLRRSIESHTRRCADVDAAATLPAERAIAGLHPAEARQHLTDAVVIAKAVAAQRGTRELEEVAAALASLAEGRPLEISGGSARRRLARGMARLLPLLAA